MFLHLSECPHMQTAVTRLAAEFGDSLAKIVPWVLRTGLLVQRLMQ